MINAGDTAWILVWCFANTVSSSQAARHKRTSLGSLPKVIRRDNEVLETPHKVRSAFSILSLGSSIALIGVIGSPPHTWGIL